MAFPDEAKDSRRLESRSKISNCTTKTTSGSLCEYSILEPARLGSTRRGTLWRATWLPDHHLKYLTTLAYNLPLRSTLCWIAAFMTFALNYKPMNSSFSATALKGLNIVVTWGGQGKHSVAAVKHSFTFIGVERTTRITRSFILDID